MNTRQVIAISMCVYLAMSLSTWTGAFFVALGWLIGEVMIQTYLHFRNRYRDIHDRKEMEQE